MNTARIEEPIRTELQKRLKAARRPAPICSLMLLVFERHGRTGSNDLKSLRPINGTNRYRDGLRDHGKFWMLWYEQDLGNGHFTSRAVRLDREGVAG